MSKVIKNIIVSILFVSIFVPILMLFSALMRPSGSAKFNALDDPMVNGILDEKKETIDVLFLGDSLSYSAFVPLNIWEKHGITSYVCGSTEQVLSYSYELLVKCFTTQSPKVIVLEANNLFREVTKTKAFINKAEGLFAVFKYHDRWKQLLPDLNANNQKTFDTNNKGYLFNTTKSAALLQNYMIDSDEKEIISNANIKYIEKIKKLCKKNKAELILVSVPSVKNWSFEKSNAVSDLAKNSGIEFIDMNVRQKEVAIDWQNDTRDKGDHLNYYGAVKVSEYFGEYFEEKKIFDDKRSDPEYESWNISVRKFHEQLK